jgi:hypothetical protein
MKPKHAPEKLNAQELQTAIAEFIQKVSQFFNAEIVNTIARETDFVARESKLTGHLFLTVFTFGMSVYGTPSLNQLIGLLHRVMPQLELTRQGLHERINDEAVTFFEKMLSLAIAIELPKCLSEVMASLCSHFNRIVIFDSTSFQLPEELAPYFRGSGGAGSNAAVKILFGYDLKSYQFFYLLQDGVAHDQLRQNGFLDHLHAGDLEISDLGFFNIAAFADIDEKGAYYLSRLRSDVNLYQATDTGFEEFDLVRFVKQLQVQQTEREVYLKTGQRFTKTRLIIERVPDQVKGQRLRQRNRYNRKKGHQTRKWIKILAGFNLFITNAPTTHIPRQQIRSLYGVRWQIELIFKNWKSNFNLAQVTGKRPERIKCMIYAKLLFIFINTKIIAAIRQYVWRMEKREVSDIQAAKHLILVAQSWFDAIVQNPKDIVQLLKNAITFIMKRCLKGKSKKRTYPLTLLEKLPA